MLRAQWVLLLVAGQTSLVVAKGTATVIECHCGSQRLTYPIFIKSMCTWWDLFYCENKQAKWQRTQKVETDQLKRVPSPIVKTHNMDCNFRLKNQSLPSSLFLFFWISEDRCQSCEDFCYNWLNVNPVYVPGLQNPEFKSQRFLGPISQKIWGFIFAERVEMSKDTYAAFCFGIICGS